MKFKSIIGFLPLVLFGGYFFAAPAMMGPTSMMTFSSPPSVKVRRTDPPLDDPRLEAARQVETYQMVTTRLNRCRSRFFNGDYEERKEIDEVYRTYMERNRAKRDRALEMQQAETGKIQAEFREDLEETGDGLLGSIHKTIIMRKRRKEIAEDVQRSFGGSSVQIVTDFPSDPAYSDCYSFMVEVAHGKYNIKVPKAG